MSEKESFGHFARGVEPDVSANHREAIQVALQVRENIGSATDALIKSIRQLGLGVDVCDGAYQVEASIYAWIKKANPGHPGFAIAEALGRAEQAGRASQLQTSLAPSLMGPAVDKLKAAAWAAEDRLGVLVESDNEDHGGAGEDDLAAFHALREALKPFGSRPGERVMPEVPPKVLSPFEEFLATGREVSDLSMFVPDVVSGQAGYLYDQGRYIERQVDGKLYLRLGNEEFSDVPQANKRRLEAILYVWAVSDGSRRDASKEFSAAAEAAHYICSFTTAEKRTQALLANLRELRPRACHVQDIADAWPILDMAAQKGTDLNLAYELMCGLLALQ